MGDVVFTEKATHVLGAHAKLCGDLRGGLRAVGQDTADAVDSWWPAGLGSVPCCSGNVTDMPSEPSAIGPCAECDLFVEARAFNAAAVRRVEHLVPTLAAARVFEISLAGGAGSSGQFLASGHTAPHRMADQKR